MYQTEMTVRSRGIGELLFLHVSSSDNLVDGYPMAIDERVEVTFAPQRRQGWLAIGLCADTTCSQARITGVDGDRRLTGTTSSNPASNSVAEIGKTQQIVCKSSLSSTLKSHVEFFETIFFLFFQKWLPMRQ